mmetsp:Transcript_24042/g.58951  ORF Transcript_24042/g.58951 Transcript_24042/m.58951 type:complete len:240 (+) Transcript_24042:565-1284(+)
MRPRVAAPVTRGQREGLGAVHGHRAGEEREPVSRELHGAGDLRAHALQLGGAELHVVEHRHAVHQGIGRPRQRVGVRVVRGADDELGARLDGVAIVTPVEGLLAGARVVQVALQVVELVGDGHGAQRGRLGLCGLGAQLGLGEVAIVNRGLEHLTHDLVLRGGAVHVEGDHGLDGGFAVGAREALRGVDDDGEVVPTPVGELGDGHGLGDALLLPARAHHLHRGDVHHILVLLLHAPER